MNHRLRFTAATVAARLKLIARHACRRWRPLPPFRLRELKDAAEDPPFGADPRGWPTIEPDSYWGRADLNFLLSGAFKVPRGWRSDRLALHLPLGSFGDIFNHPEALVLIDGSPAGSADRYHHTLRLDPGTADGRCRRLELHGWTGHTGWPPDPTDRAMLRMGKPALIERNPDLDAFIALAGAALESADLLPDGELVKDRLLDALRDAFVALDTREVPGGAFHESAAGALACLKDGLAAAGEPLETVLHGIGHAHMDIAYLWPVGQIRRKAIRTFSNVLRLMDAEPDYRFSHSQPQIYEFCARDAPELFRGIRRRVAEGRWELIGGMWVEPDMNIPGPEALVRQLQLGRRYFREQFGDLETPVLWLPDTFGFPGQTPQLMVKSGLRWFCTNKLNWNQVTRVPATHHWEGIDGSRVLTHVLTTPRDVEYLPFPTNYKSDLTAREVMGTAAGARPGSRSLPICYGYGDGGGGPTEELLAKVRAFRAMPGMPRMKFSTVRAAFEAIESERAELPSHRGEHYLEGHRGTLTSQAWLKRANRKNERALHEAEALSAMAGLTPDLSEAWALLCRNQFHDILAGTAVREVFEDSRSDHSRISSLAEAAAREAAAAIAARADDMLALNTSPVAGGRVLEIPCSEAAGLPCQSAGPAALVYLPDLPPYSAVSVPQAAAPAPDGISVSVTGAGAVLQNRCIRAEFDRCGRLISAFDKAAGREILASSEAGNQFQAFEDRPICWDAWDIDPGFEDRTDLIEESANIAIEEIGPIRAALRVKFRWRKSEFRQLIRLCAHSPRIDFVTRISWRERHTLLKVAFPAAARSKAAWYDIQWGAIARPTTRETPADFARFEVPAHKWAALADGNGGAALLNDCKYGHDVRGRVMRLTLIKSSTSPDPEADQGEHRFTYSFMPLQREWRSATDAAAYDLNTPLRAVRPGRSHRASRLRRQPFLSLTGARVICETLKPAGGGGAILRLFEPEGRAGRATLHFGPRMESAEICDLLDIPRSPTTLSDNSLTLEFRPFEIITLKVTPDSSS